MLKALKLLASQTGHNKKPRPLSCSHQDYDQINNERDQRQTKLTQEQQEKEQQIAQHFNNTLELDLEKNPTLSQVITRLQELLRQPGSPSKISETPFGEDLAVIREIDLVMLRNILPQQLTKSEIQSINQATNYQELASTRSEILSQALGKGQQETEIIKRANRQLTNQQQEERIMWLILILVS